jgi:hypothetical protein
MGYSPLLRGRVQGLARGITVPNAQPDASGLASVNPIFTFVRLAHRVPVRVHIDEVPEGVTLVAGLTATVQVEPYQAPPISGSKLSSGKVSEAAPQPTPLETLADPSPQSAPPQAAPSQATKQATPSAPPSKAADQPASQAAQPRAAPQPPQSESVAPQPTRLPPISRRSKNRSPPTPPLGPRRRRRRTIAEMGRPQTRWGRANTLGRPSTFTTARVLSPHRCIDPPSRSTGAPARGGGTGGDINRARASSPSR